MDKTVIERIVKEIEHFAPKAESAHVGRVSAVGDGVCSIDGLAKAVMSEILEFEEHAGKSLKDSMESEGKLFGLILNLE